MFVLLIILAAALAAVALRNRWFSFGAQRPKRYAATKPQFDIRRVLDGPMISEGVIFGPGGRAVSRFVARMEGAWEGADGTLSEWFEYDSGRTQARKWHLKSGNDGSFTATADDIIGQATGRQSGATVNMRYRIRLPKEAGGHVLSVTDWLYLMPDGTIMNRSEMRKFGLCVAELIATMRPMPHA